MNTRKTLLAAAASGALILPVVLAAPAYANPGGGCSDENAGAAGQTLPKCGSNLLHVGTGVGVGVHANLGVGGTCGDDTLLLIQVRANEGGTHKTLVDARTAYNTAQTNLTTAKANDLAAENAVNAAQAQVNTDNAAIAADNDGVETTPDAQDLAAAAASARLGSDKTALASANDTEAQRDNELEAAQHAFETARGNLNRAEAADHVLVVRINALVDRINHECGTPTPVPPTTTAPPPVALPTPTDTPPPAAIVPPGSNNTQVIVQGPAPQIVQGPSQIGQAPQGYVSAGGGADAAIVSAQS